MGREARARLDEKGRVAIPLAVRRELGVEEGDNLVFEIDDGEIRIVAARGPVSSADYAGIWCEGEGMSMDEVNAYVRDLRGHNGGRDEPDREDWR